MAKDNSIITQYVDKIENNVKKAIEMEKLAS